MQSRARIMQPSRSVVMHEHVKDRARDGMGTAVTVREKRAHGQARYGLRGAGASAGATLSSVDASGARAGS